LENQTNNKPENTEKQTEEKTESIFTREEIVATVRSFILAWIKNDLKIHFPVAEEIMNNEKKAGNRVDKTEAHYREQSGKMEIINTISILAGLTPATRDEKEKAITLMFKHILGLRCGDRVEGSFGKKEDYDLHLSSIEEQIEAMNNSIQQLIIWYRSLVTPRN
jgi:hypothetical protein